MRACVCVCVCVHKRACDREPFMSCTKVISKATRMGVLRLMKGTDVMFECIHY